MTGDGWLAAALDTPGIVGRFLSKLVEVPGSECLYWTGAVSGAGHGRFWVGEGHVVIAHRFAYALVHGSSAMPTLLGHRCDNPLCQRVSPEHVSASTASRNRVEWLIRRRIAAGPLADPRGPLARARALRDLARVDPMSAAADITRVTEIVGHQPVLI